MLKHSTLPHQIDAIERLQSGSVLLGGVGVGKTHMALRYYQDNYPELPLYVITTPKKRDDGDWSRYAQEQFDIDCMVDSWNNVNKYVGVSDAFFIFDEQRAIGYGTWGKSFIKIGLANDWIMATATPADNWIQMMPLFIANGYYRNKTHFVQEHVRYKPNRTYPIISHYVNTDRLRILRDRMFVEVKFQREVERYELPHPVDYDEDKYKHAMATRWNPFKNQPIKSASELTLVARRITNSHPSRLEAVKRLQDIHKRVIVFYNFNFERDILLSLDHVDIAEYSGHKHQDIPDSDNWIYLVQYTAGSEAWETVETCTTIFYSANYSYRTMVQAKGRMDRMNSEYDKLYYYFLESNSPIDSAISAAYSRKEDFNRDYFISQLSQRI